MKSQIVISITVQELKELIQEAVRSELSRDVSSTPAAHQPRYMSRKETCKMLGISLGTLSKYIKRGDVRAKRLGHKVFVLEEDAKASMRTIKSVKGSREYNQS